MWCKQNMPVCVYGCLHLPYLSLCLSTFPQCLGFVNCLLFCPSVLPLSLSLYLSVSMVCCFFSCLSASHLTPPISGSVCVYSRECQGEAHEPCDCDTWKLWLQKVTEMRPEECEYWLQFTKFMHFFWYVSDKKF